MALSKRKIQEMVAQLQKRFPNWRSFSSPPDPNFHSDEIDYKQNLSNKAKQLLNPETFKAVFNSENGSQIDPYETLLANIETVGKAANLLYLSVPSSGDLSILYSPNLDKPTFCQFFFDLLYGDGSSEERLARYLDYVRAQHLPSTWTFPTYYLFLCYPDTEIFIKPTITKSFLLRLGEENRFSAQPTAESYGSIKAFFHGNYSG